MRKKRSQYQMWADDALKVRMFGWTGSWIIWAAIAVFLIGSFIHYDLQSRTFADFMGSLFHRPSAPQLVFVARNNIPIFTILTKDNIAIKLDDQAGKNITAQHSPDNDQIVKQREMLDHRITLRHFNKGEEIRPIDLGPEIPSNLEYQVQEINANSSIAWIHPGDTLNFALADTSCFPSSTPTAGTTSNCPLQTILKNVVIIQVGKTKPDGLIPLLVAIPSKENDNVLALLDQRASTIVVYPVVNITYIPTEVMLLVT